MRGGDLYAALGNQHHRAAVSHPDHLFYKRLVSHTYAFSNRTCLRLPRSTIEQNHRASAEQRSSPGRCPSLGALRRSGRRAHPKAPTGSGTRRSTGRAGPRGGSRGCSRQGPVPAALRTAASPRSCTGLPPAAGSRVRAVIPARGCRYRGRGRREEGLPPMRAEAGSAAGCGRRSRGRRCGRGGGCGRGHGLALYQPGVLLSPLLEPAGQVRSLRAAHHPQLLGHRGAGGRAAPARRAASAGQRSPARPGAPPAGPRRREAEQPQKEPGGRRRRALRSGDPVPAGLQSVAPPEEGRLPLGQRQ